MLKTKAFTLFETLISLVILSITISGLVNLFSTSNSYQTYKDLQEQENNFYLKGTVTSNDKIKFIQYK